MTTIAANRTCMAADNKVTDSDRVYYTNKLRVIDGCIVAAAGLCADSNTFFDWFRSGREAPYPALTDDPDTTFECLVLSPRGLFAYSCCGEPDELDDGHYAIGTGSPVALYCMRALKMTPEQAVYEAFKVDPNSGVDPAGGPGGKVRVYNLADIPAPKKGRARGRS